MKLSGILLAATLLMVGCVSSPKPTIPGSETNLTVGLVQKEIHVGMHSLDVIGILGSPNIVKKNSSGHEIWVYDKFSTDQVQQKSAGILAYVGGNGGGSILGSRGNSSTSQSSLTIILGFDDQERIDSIAYHRSKF